MNTMDNMTMELGAAQGWQCPVCKTVNSPWKHTCDCAGVKPVVTTTASSFEFEYEPPDDKRFLLNHLIAPRPLSLLQSLKLCKVLIDDGISIDKTLDVAKEVCFVCNIDTDELDKLTKVQLQEYMKDEEDQ